LGGLYLSYQVSKKELSEDSFHVGKSSRRRDPAEFSGTFWNISLVYKFCNLLYLLIGLQRNTIFSKSNQRATAFLQHFT